MIHAARIIPTDGRKHLPSHLRLWDGDSVGHWEGDTLVVDVTNYNGRGWIATNAAAGNMRGVLQSDALHVGREVSQGECEHDSLRGDDRRSKVLHPPVDAGHSARTGRRIPAVRVRCQEGNHSVENMHRAARVAEGQKGR
jgi:hypothetical protein